MEELIERCKHDPTNGLGNKIVSNQLSHKKLSPITFKQSLEKKQFQTNTTLKKINYLKSKPKRKAAVEGPKNTTCKQKISRPCRTEAKEKDVKTIQNETISDGNSKQGVIKTDEECFKNLLAFDATPDSDSLESDFDEERGFTTADRFLMLNHLSKELERRERVMKDIKKQKIDELIETQKSESDVENEFSTYDLEINNIIKNIFKDTGEEDAMQHVPKKIEYTKKVTESLAKDNSLDSEDSYDTENIEFEVEKLIKSLNKRIREYNVNETVFGQNFDPFEGVTDQRLHHFFLNEVMTNVEKSTKVAFEDKQGAENVVSNVYKCLDVSHPLSSEERRQKSKKLINYKSETSLKKKSKRNFVNIPKTIPFGAKQSERYLKKLSTKERLTKQVMVPLLDETDEIVGKGKECDEEFRIMFSDISTEEEDEGEEEHHQKENVDKMEDVTKLSFKETLGKFMKHMKDPSTTQSGKKSDMQPLFKHKKQTQEEEKHRKREFVRWFGKSLIQDDKEEFSAAIPCWEPGWRRLDSHLKVDILKNERDENLRYKKVHESDPIEEYRRLLKEYEQLVGKVGSTDDKRDEKSGEKDMKPGEKWIKIRKGILLRDYQIRWRQGMYYLVERKHIKKNKKQTSRKKKAIYEDTNKASHSKLLVKTFRPLNVKRYLGNKAGSKMVNYKKPFRKRGEAVKEIRRILSHLKRKYLNEGTEDLMDKNNMKLEWTLAKLTNHLKKKCQELGLEVTDNEQNGGRELFRKYCLLYFETKLQNRENRLKKEQQDKYPLGLFRPKAVVNGDFDDELSEGSEEACSDDDILEEALIKEVFSFWKSDFQPTLGRDSEIRSFETKKEKRIINTGKVICRKQSRFMAESPSKPSNNKSKIKNKEEPLPENCRELFDLPPDLEDSFFGSKKEVSTLHSKIPFGDKYLMQDKSYLGTSSQSQCSFKKYVDVISEMKLEGLIQTDDYEFLKDDEAIFPWDEIHIELLERPAYISKKEDKPPPVKYEAVSEEEDSWSDPDDLHLPCK